MVEASRQLGVSQSRLYELKDRYERYGEARLFPKRRPSAVHPARLSPALRDQVIAYAVEHRYFPDLTRLTWRTGATFVHDWFALGLGLLIVGHIIYAPRDRESRRGMRTGRVSATWARAQHAALADELEAGPVEPGDTANSG